MARFFIDRPIFAWVLAIVVMMAGALAIWTLPIAQYPSIAPPSVSITATYPGASAKVVEDSVTQVIEQRMKGIDGLRYMSANSSSSGQVEITLTFDPGTDPDIAQVQVQNKLSLATPLLPEEVQRQGVQVAKASSSFLMVVGLVAAEGSDFNQTDLADYMASNIQDPISRVEGVGEVQLFGAQYSMRVWLDPTKLVNFGLVPADIIAAIRAQNAQVAAGQLGGLPSTEGQQLNATITAQSLLQTPEEFRQIFLRTAEDGSAIRLGDVGRVEVGAETYATSANYNGRPSTGLAIQLASGANALETAEAVRAEMQQLEAMIPEGMEVIIPYDTTPFVKVSIESVVETLIEAIVLVFLVMYLFLQNFRATLIPTIAVPVVLLGTFAVLELAGFSINVLTMFAMVLAIGLLVDDAIVVVENVERVMHDEKLPPKEATRKSMDQITGALIGIGLVLSAVFIPMAFFGGSTGVIYRQFSITIVAAMGLSVLTALILTPALCATILKPSHSARRGPFAWFNRGFEKTTNGYVGLVGYMARRGVRFLIVYLILAAGMGYMFLRLPTAFLPDEDQGIMFVQAQLPVGATQERTLEVLKTVERHFLENEADSVASIFTVAGFSFAGSGQNAGIGFVLLKDWEEREEPSQNVAAIAGRAMGAFSQIRDAMVFAFAPPAVLELGNATGFDVQLQDRSGQGHEALMAARNQFLGMAAQNPNLVGVRPNGLEDQPEYRIDIDHHKVGALGLSIEDVNDALAAAWGGTYINDFLDRGRIKKVYVQADAPYRMVPEDLDQWYVRNNQGEMVPFSAFASAYWAYGSPRLERYNGLPSVEILGQPAPGLSSGAAMDAVEQMMAQLPPGFGYEWTGLSDQERAAGAQAPLLYAISILVVFLCLAALYESWSIPFSVMLVVPLGVLGALSAATLTGLSNDVFFQVGLLTTIGLAAKNAILIVEFAKDLNEAGKSLMDATLEAARLRLRPIIMTSLAFGLGVTPLAISSGAGSGGQNAIGIGVLGGVIAATFLGILFVPLFFVTVRKLFSRKKQQPETPRAEAVPAE
ncbi:MAG TPA: efflux RND transporter permease subunit [Geminicoccus sp.]|uniref:efflux RND transporter permease subunit n=1 Tax=Geminicoccus sp. TaxID=2024832 RepID=UPI002E35FB6D|nr:efflux RND transporter permease subunit [Geminicoccus sp.]HEX2529799.1 efflux RND transporter permease subunit [Geminicoccus sp.]